MFGRGPRACCSALVALSLVASGCRTGKEYRFLADDGQVRYARNVATEIEYPDAEGIGPSLQANTLPPNTISRHESLTPWPMTLEEAVKMALATSDVIRDLGGRIINGPQAVATAYDAALQESHPLYGVEGALSAFDAEATTSIFWENNHRALNNIFLGGGVRDFQQQRSPFTAQLTKRTATGSQLSVRNNTIYDLNNSPGNLFHSAYDTQFEGEIRQPLLQGAGVEYNRIAGPQGTRSQAANGVSIARINTDISLTQFEVGIQTLVSDVENAYWDLYYAYRDLDAKILHRDKALELWRKADAKQEAADREMQAREQYFSAKLQVEDALAGTPRRGTQTGAGTGGGYFAGVGGVYSCERKLRFLLGLPPADGSLIRPADEPSTAKITFDWNEVVDEALYRRVELRRQKWLIKRRELELVAARNYLLPRLDALALYRFRGFGNDLLGPSLSNDNQFDNAFGNLMLGHYQEWQMGAQLNVPLGFRQAMAGVRNAELQLTRERAVLANQERQIVHEMSEAIAEVERAHNALTTQFDRRLAAERQLALVENKAANPPSGEAVPIEFIFDAQRRWTDAQLAYFRTLVEYNVAVKNVHWEKGSLLDHCEVYLAEGPWNPKAYVDARKRTHERSVARPMDYKLTRPDTVSRGGYPQQMDTEGMLMAPGAENVVPPAPEAPAERLPPSGEPPPPPPMPPVKA